MAEPTLVQGHIKDWAPSDGKKPGKAVVGGKFATVWKTKKDELGDPIPNPAYEQFAAAAAANTPVRVKGFDKAGKFGPEFTVVGATTTGVEDAEVEAGDKASDEAIKNKPARSGGGFAPRDETWQAARWAVSSALEVAGEGIDLSKKETQETIEAYAKFLLGLSLDLKDFAKKLTTPKAQEAGAGSQNGSEPKNELADVF